MELGNVVEYIDQQKIISAVILSEKKGKLRLLNENSREVNFSRSLVFNNSAISTEAGDLRSILIVMFLILRFHTLPN